MFPGGIGLTHFSLPLPFSCIQISEYTENAKSWCKFEPSDIAQTLFLFLLGNVTSQGTAWDSPGLGPQSPGSRMSFRALAVNLVSRRYITQGALLFTVSATAQMWYAQWRLHLSQATFSSLGGLAYNGSKTSVHYCRFVDNQSAACNWLCLSVFSLTVFRQLARL